MNRDEELVGAWLVDQGHAVRHMVDGEDPPDFVVDGNIAVEVTTIASYADRSLWDFMDGVCKSLGPAENGRGYWIEFASDDEALLQDRKHRGMIKGELKRGVKDVLRRHYASPDAVIGRFELPHGVEIEIIGRINKNRDDVKYKVGMGGATGGMIVVSYLIETIQAAIDSKTDKRLIKECADSYAEWWLVVTDPHYVGSLESLEIGSVANEIHYGEPWRRILLASTRSGRVNAVHCLAGNRC